MSLNSFRASNAALRRRNRSHRRRNRSHQWSTSQNPATTVARCRRFAGTLIRMSAPDPPCTRRQRGGAPAPRACRRRPDSPGGPTTPPSTTRRGPFSVRLAFPQPPLRRVVACSLSESRRPRLQARRRLLFVPGQDRLAARGELPHCAGRWGRYCSRSRGGWRKHAQRQPATRQQKAVKSAGRGRGTNKKKTGPVPGATSRRRTRTITRITRTNGRGAGRPGGAIAHHGRGGRKTGAGGLRRGSRRRRTRAITTMKKKPVVGPSAGRGGEAKTPSRAATVPGILRGTPRGPLRSVHKHTFSDVSKIIFKKIQKL